MALLIAGKGLVAGVLISVLIWPLFFMLRKVVSEPAATVALLTCFGEHCKDPIDEDDAIYGIVMAILDASDIDLGTVDEAVSDIGEVVEQAKESVTNGQAEQVHPGDATGESGAGAPDINTDSEDVFKDIISGSWDDSSVRAMASDYEFTRSNLSKFLGGSSQFAEQVNKGFQNTELFRDFGSDGDEGLEMEEAIPAPESEEEKQDYSNVPLSNIFAGILGEIPESEYD